MGTLTFDFMVAMDVILRHLLIFQTTKQVNEAWKQCFSDCLQSEINILEYCKIAASVGISDHFINIYTNVFAVQMRLCHGFWGMCCTGPIPRELMGTRPSNPQAARQMSLEVMKAAFVASSMCRLTTLRLLYINEIDVPAAALIKRADTTTKGSEARLARLSIRPKRPWNDASPKPRKVPGLKPHDTLATIAEISTPIPPTVESTHRPDPEPETSIIRDWDSFMKKLDGLGSEYKEISAPLNELRARFRQLALEKHKKAQASVEALIDMGWSIIRPGEVIEDAAEASGDHSLFDDAELVEVNTEE